jgi:hypothetical protein
MTYNFTSIKGIAKHNQENILKISNMWIYKITLNTLVVECWLKFGYITIVYLWNENQWYQFEV